MQTTDFIKTVDETRQKIKHTNFSDSLLPANIRENVQLCDKLLDTVVDITNFSNANLTFFTTSHPILVSMLQLADALAKFDSNDLTPPTPPIDNQTIKEDDKNMETRIEQLEKDMALVKTDVAVIRSNYCTKEDLHREISVQTWRLVIFTCGFGSALVASVYFIAKHTP